MWQKKRRLCADEQVPWINKISVRVKTPLADIVEILVDCAVPSRGWRNLSAGREPLLFQPTQTSTSCRPSNRLPPILQQMPVILPIVTLQKYKFSWFCHRLTAGRCFWETCTQGNGQGCMYIIEHELGLVLCLARVLILLSAKPVKLANVNRIANQQIQTESFNVSSNHFPYQQCSHNWKLLNQSSPVTLKVPFTSLTQNS